jgi:hypothetical protein
MRLIPDTKANIKTEALGQSSNYGVHDTFRDGIQTVRGNIIGGHPLETHLTMVGFIQW